MMVRMIKLLVCLLLSNTMYTAAPEAVMAGIPGGIKKAFTEAAQQFVRLKSEKVTNAQELYYPYAKAAGTVVQDSIAMTDVQGRDAHLHALANALKLSFWYPEIWVGTAKQADKKYEAIFAKPTLNDGADRLVGEVFARYQFTAEGMAEATKYLITNTLFTVRSNSALQGTIISGLSVFLKTFLDTRDMVVGLFEVLKQPSLSQYAAQVGNIITQELPKYSPLIRGLIINSFIEFLLKSPLISVDENSQNFDPKEMSAIKQKCSTFSTRQEYASYIRDIITKINSFGTPATHYKVLQEIRSILLESPIIIAPPMRSRPASLPEEITSRSCKWYEVDCWIMKGFEELEIALRKKAKEKPIATCKKPTPQSPKGSAREFSVVTMNTYCFPKDTSSVLRAAKDIAGAFSSKSAGDIPNLQSGIHQSVDVRIKKIAELVGSLDADVVCFQELWSDENKETMAGQVCSRYPYIYYVNAQIPAYSLVMMDDGLMIASVRPFIFTQAITYRDRIEDEKLANKGALFVGLEDREGKPIIIVNTHLQSGRSLEAIAIKNKQMHAIGQTLQVIIEEHPRFKDGRICIAGDLNEAIQFKNDHKLLADRTHYLVQALQDEGIDVSNDQVLRLLSDRLGADELVEIDELGKQGTIKKPTGSVKGFIGIEDPLIQRAGTYQFDVIDYASDPDGTQLLDHILLDNKSRLTQFDVFRQQVLGGKGHLEGGNLPQQAISDHAAVRAVFERAG